MMLEGRVIYCVVTGANRTKNVGDFLSLLQDRNADKIILIPTINAVPFLREASIPNGVIVRSDTIITTERIPEEDIVVVAPCTFDTMNKLTNGIADNYAMSVVHAAIGKKKPIIVAFSMGAQYWNHPLTDGAVKTLQSFGIETIWPEFVYTDDGTLEKITMSPWEKVTDSVCHKFQKTRYESDQHDRDSRYDKATAKYADLFKQTGSTLLWQHFVNGPAGFIALKIPDGILITRTGAEVGKLNDEDLTLIIGHEDKKISWMGYGAPSSETPMVLEIFERYPKARAIIHGHCREITYSKLANKYKSEKYLSYGQFGEAAKLYPILDKHGIAIMRLHGEVAIGKDFNDALGKYFDIYHKLVS